MRDMLLETDLPGVMRFSNWVPNTFFNGDDLTSFIRLRHEGETPWFRTKKQSYITTKATNDKKNPPLK